MEDVLDVYHRPYDEKRPLVCLDESSKQLIGETVEPIPAAPGRPERFDHEYVRNGVINLFMITMPLLGWRAVQVTDRRTMLDFAEVVRWLVEEIHEEAEKVTPKHGSWLNMAEIELSVLARQCLDQRIETKADLERHVAAWEEERNERGDQIKWRFTTADARIKLHRLYPVL